MLNEELIPIVSHNIKDKTKNANTRTGYMLARILPQIKVNGLPDTIPEKDLKIQLLTAGYTFITDKADGNLRCFTGGLGGKLSYVYEPTLITVANPALDFSESLDIEKDGVLIECDSLRMGVIPNMSKYSYLLTEAEITLYTALINARMQFLLTAEEGEQKDAADIFIQKILSGDLSTVVDKSWGGDETIKAQPLSNSGNGQMFTQIIELFTYLEGRCFQDMGFTAPSNAKRESLNDDECSLSDEVTFSYVSAMLESWRRGFDEVNKRYDTSITVELTGVYEHNESHIKPEEQEGESVNELDDTK